MTHLEQRGAMNEHGRKTALPTPCLIWGLDRLSLWPAATPHAETQAPPGFSVGYGDPSVFSPSLACPGVGVEGENQHSPAIHLPAPTTMDHVGSLGFRDQLNEGPAPTLASGLFGASTRTCPGRLAIAHHGLWGGHMSHSKCHWGPWASLQLSLVYLSPHLLQGIHSKSISLTCCFSRPVLGAQIECVCGWGGQCNKWDIYPFLLEQML